MLPSAFGPPGISGDAEAILYVADRLANLYRATLEWKLDFRRMALPAEMERLRSIEAGYCDNMVREIEEFSRKLKEFLSVAIPSLHAGRPARLDLWMTWPDRGEYNQEADRVLRLIQSGALGAE